MIGCKEKIIKLLDVLGKWSVIIVFIPFQIGLDYMQVQELGTSRSIYLQQRPEISVRYMILPRKFSVHSYRYTAGSSNIWRLPSEIGDVRFIEHSGIPCRNVVQCTIVEQFIGLMFQQEKWLNLVSQQLATNWLTEEIATAIGNLKTDWMGGAMSVTDVTPEGESSSIGADFSQ